MQNYLLGLAQVPFWKYLGLSTMIVGSLTVAILFFGEAVWNKGKVAFIAISLFLALMAATHLLRKHYGRKKTP